MQSLCHCQVFSATRDGNLLPLADVKTLDIEVLCHIWPYFAIVNHDISYISAFLRRLCQEILARMKDESKECLDALVEVGQGVICEHFVASENIDKR